MSIVKTALTSNPRGGIRKVNRKRPVFAAVTAATLSSLLLGCAQAPPKPLPTFDSAASTPAASSEAPPEGLASTTPEPWNSSLYGPSPEDLERQAEPAISAAKADAIAVMNEMAAQLPADIVADFTHGSTGSLLNCGPHEMQWTSGGEITLKAPADPDRTLATIGEHWTTQPGYQVIYYHSRMDGRPQVKIKGPKHATYITSLVPHKTTMSIGAFSACFKVPAGFTPGGGY